MSTKHVYILMCGKINDNTLRKKKKKKPKKTKGKKRTSKALSRTATESGRARQREESTQCFRTKVKHDEFDKASLEYIDDEMRKVIR